MALTPDQIEALDARALKALDRVQAMVTSDRAYELSEQVTAAREYMYSDGAEYSAARGLVAALERAVGITTTPPATTPPPASSPPSTALVLSSPTLAAVKAKAAAVPPWVWWSLLGAAALGVVIWQSKED